MSRKVQAQGGRPRSLPEGTRWRWQIKAKVLARGVAATPGACSSSTMRKLRHVEDRKRKRSIAGALSLGLGASEAPRGACSSHLHSFQRTGFNQLSKERAFTMAGFLGRDGAARAKREWRPSGRKGCF
jgi:hypothetical protein